jgi:hypothetical protein
MGLLTIEGRAMRNAAIAVVVLHTVTALWVWRSWGELGRDAVLLWMDFPVSFVYSHLSDPGFLLGSVLLGGLQWAALAAGLTYLLGRSTRDA